MYQIFLIINTVINNNKMLILHERYERNIVLFSIVIKSNDIIVYGSVVIYNHCDHSYNVQ